MRHFSRVTKFVVAGALGAAVNLAATALAELLGAPYLAASTVGFLSGFVAHFLAQRAAYGVRGDRQGRSQMLAFGLLSAENLSLTVFAAYAGVEVFRLPLVVAQGVAVVLLAAQNYWAYPRLVFRRDAAGAPLPPRVLACLALALSAVWLVAHLPALRYGTAALPLHQSYVGDEQSPVNAALHVLNQRSPLALRNNPNLYYGPVMASLAVPAVAADYLSGCWAGLGCSPEAFRARLLFDWGGTVRAARLFAVVAALAGLGLAFAIFRTPVFNPAGRRWLPYAAALLLAANFYYFEYAGFFKHWPFVVTLALVDVWALARVDALADPRRRIYWAIGAIAGAASFGLSFFSALYRVAYLPFVVAWWRRGDWARLRELVLWGFGFALLAALMVAWHPYAIMRLAAGRAFVSGGGEESTGSSVLFYLRLLVENHLGFIVAGVAAISLACRRIVSSPAFWALAAVAAANFALFASQSRHEARYMLPTAAFSLLALAYVAGRAEWGGAPVRRSLALASAAFALAVHLGAIGLWSAAISEGPAEERFLSEVRSELAARPASTTVLVLQDYLVGAPHTRAGYASYLASFKSGEQINLYDAILAEPTPAGAIDFRYVVPPGFAESRDKIAAREWFARGSFPADVAEGHDLAYWRFRPRVEVNQFDFFDESLPRVVWHADLLDRYVLIGGGGEGER